MPLSIHAAHRREQQISRRVSDRQALTMSGAKYSKLTAEKARENYPCVRSWAADTRALAPW